MEGVGARLGRSSTRYGPATVFTGPVRKWKKKWVHVSPSNKKDNNSTATAANGGLAADGSNESHLLLYKWTPLSQSGNGNSNGSCNGESNSPSDDSTAVATEEPPRRKFKYVPIAVMEEQKRETPENEEEEEKVDEDAKPSDNNNNDNNSDSSKKKEDMEEKPDINDVPMEETQEDGKIVRQDLNESTLDLSLNLNAGEGDSENDHGEDNH